MTEQSAPGLPWRYGDVVEQDGKVFRRSFNDRACHASFDSVECDYPWEHFDGEGTDQYPESTVDPAQAVLLARNGEYVGPPVPSAVSPEATEKGRDDRG